MDVPKLNRTVGLESGGYTPAIQPITREAFGEGVDAENAKTGQIIGNLGAELQAHINAKNRFDEEQASNDAANAALNKTHDAHDKALEKTGGQAIGAYAGTIKTDNPAIQLTDTSKYGVPDVTLPGYHKEELDPESFIAQSAKNKQEMLATLKTPQQRDHASRLYDAGTEVLGRSVSQHEAQQTQVYQEQAMASNITTWAGIYAANPTAPGAQDFLNNAESSVKDFSKLKKEDDASAGLRLQQVNDTFAKKTIEAHPEFAGELLKLNLSTEGRAMVQGKQVDNLQNDIIAAISSGSANVLNADATPSLEKTLSFVDAQAKAQKFTPEQTTQAESQARSLISTKTAEINQNREQALKKFSDSTLQAFNAGKSREEMTDTFVKKDSSVFTGYPHTDTDTKQAIVDTLFTNTNAAREKALTHRSPAQLLALDQAMQTIRGMTGDNLVLLAGTTEKQKQSLVATEIMKKYVADNPNVTPDEITAHAKDIFKNVDTTVEGRLWGLFGTRTEPESVYKLQAEQNQAGAEENAVLERTYTPVTVQQAKDALISQGVQPTPKNILTAIQRMKGVKPTAAESQAAYQAQFDNQFKRGMK